MKNFRVTVNGNTYDVVVEELKDGSAVSAPTAIASAPVSAPKAAAAPAAKSDKPQVSGKEGSKKIESPMPGNIFDIKVSVGDKVTANSVVIILEAMKMENEIVTPVSGTVASINVTKGSTVNSGDVLITIEE